MIRTKTTTTAKTTAKKPAKKTSKNSAPVTGEIRLSDSQKRAEKMMEDYQNEMKNIFSDEESLFGWLKREAGLHTLGKYSDCNKALILMQNENASVVGTYQSWLKQGLQVQKGEKAMYILRPSYPKYLNLTLTNGKTVLKRYSAATAEEKDTGKIVSWYYKTMPVFDISQTDADSDKQKEVLLSLTGTTQNDSTALELLPKIQEKTGITGSGNCAEHQIYDILLNLAKKTLDAHKPAPYFSFITRTLADVVYSLLGLDDAWIVKKSVYDGGWSEEDKNFFGKLHKTMAIAMADMLKIVN